MVPFLDLPQSYKEIQGEVESAVKEILASGNYVSGKRVAAFETAFAAYSETAHCAAVNSGTSALHLALLAAGVGPGDEVITVPFTFVATVAAICYIGATPVFVDIDPATFTIDPSRVAAAVTPRTKAIIPVHLYGHPADMDPILEAAAPHGIPVIEDAAQAHGARYRGRRAGSLGHLACFSFYPGKNLGACGEGGAVVTGNPSWDKTIRMLRDWGQEKKYHHDLRGFNYRMDEVQAAILSIKLTRLDSANARRAAHAAEYSRLLAGTDVVTPRAAAWAAHVYHVYAIRAPRRDALQERLRSAGIQTGIHYPIPVHLTKAYSNLGYSPGDFPECERAAAEVLSLPMFPELTPAQIATVAAAVRQSA
jgi:dTDP-4-amino-4,6-dideoxygalactose transaminase